MDGDKFFFLEAAHVDPGRLRREREKARRLRQTGWWKRLLAAGVCHYCGSHFAAGQLTMDHIVPLARGGSSVRGNVVPACAACNRQKRLVTPAEAILAQLRDEDDGAPQ